MKTKAEERLKLVKLFSTDIPDALSELDEGTNLRVEPSKLISCKLKDLSVIEERHDILHADSQDIDVAQFEDQTIDIDVHLDLETTGFNKIFSKPVGLVHGAQVHGILESSMAITSPNKDVRKVLEQCELSSYGGRMALNNFYIVPDAFEIDYGNYKFHKDNGFWENYAKIIEKGFYVTMLQVEKFYIDILRKVASALGKSFRPYHYKNSIKFRLNGKSTAFDLDFIQQQMPELSRYFSHELKDLSAFKNFAREVNPEFLIDDRKVTHNAGDDVAQTIQQQQMVNEFFTELFKLTGECGTLSEVTNVLKRMNRDKVIAKEPVECTESEPQPTVRSLLITLDPNDPDPSETIEFLDRLAVKISGPNTESYRYMTTFASLDNNKLISASSSLEEVINNLHTREELKDIMAGNELISDRKYLVPSDINKYNDNHINALMFKLFLDVQCILASGKAKELKVVLDEIINYDDKQLTACMDCLLFLNMDDLPLERVKGYVALLNYLNIEGFEF